MTFPSASVGPPAAFGVRATAGATASAKSKVSKTLGKMPRRLRGCFVEGCIMRSILAPLLANA